MNTLITRSTGLFLRCTSCARRRCSKFLTLKLLNVTWKLFCFAKLYNFDFQFYSFRCFSNFLAFFFIVNHWSQCVSWFYDCLIAGEMSCSLMRTVSSRSDFFIQSRTAKMPTPIILFRFSTVHASVSDTVLPALRCVRCWLCCCISSSSMLILVDRLSTSVGCTLQCDQIRHSSWRFHLLIRSNRDYHFVVVLPEQLCCAFYSCSVNFKY